MKSHIELIPTKGMTREQWLLYRKTGIGASEVGTILGLNPWKAGIQLFYEKIGESPAYDLQSLSAFLGTHQEEFIADLWESWDGTVETMMENYRQGIKVRRCKRVNAYARNPEYPWLFASLDFEINKHGEKGNGTLETKTIGGYEADKWEAGFPPSYVIQIMTQCLVCEYDYGESAILKDNRDFFVLPFEIMPDVIDTIKVKTKDFWDRVVKARSLETIKFDAEMNFNFKVAEQAQAEIQQLEPGPDGSEAYYQFMKEKYRIAMPGERPGSMEDLLAAKEHKALKSRIKELEEECKLHQNTLISTIGALKCERLDFGQNGYVSWNADSNGVRRFLNKSK